MKNKKGIVGCSSIDLTPLQLIFYSVFLLLLGFIIGMLSDKQDLQPQLSECQNKIPIRNSVLFYRCEGDVFHNVLIDENNRSIYDYEIKKGCEVIE